MIVSRPERSLWILVRFAFASALLGCLANAYQAPLVSRVVPLFQTWFQLFDDTFKTVDLGVVKVMGEDVIRRTATAAHIHVVGGTVVWTGRESSMQNEVGAGLVLQPLVLGLALVFAWPWKRWGELGLRVMLACPLLAAVILFDAPALIYGIEWYGELQLLDPNHFSPLVQWGDIMNSGGRFALTAVAAAIAIIGAARVFVRSRIARLRH